jgi:hypothetical protein
MPSKATSNCLKEDKSKGREKIVTGSVVSMV